MLKRKAAILMFMIFMATFGCTDIATAHNVIIPSHVYFHLWQQDAYVNFASTTNLESIALENSRLWLDQYWLRVENANLTISKFFADYHLILIIDGHIGSTSITQVYVGDKGEPTSVHIINGTLTWDYDVSTQTLLFTIFHVSPAEVTVDWRILGDLDTDGDVDSDDLRIFTGGYGSDSERESFNPDADMNKDGNIDAHDLYLLARNYGKTSNW